MLSETELLDLFHKYRTHEITEPEFQKLQVWINSSEENHRFFSNYVKLYKRELQADASRRANPSFAWQAIERKRKSYHMRHRFYAVAAVACLLSIVVAGAVYLHSYHTAPLVVEQPSTLADAFPDMPKNKVTLTLSSGQQVVLDKDSMQTISENGLAVASGTNTSLNYQHVDTQNSTPQYNTVHVPEGSTFALTLSDGTQVTLNSSSTFRYPVAFTKDRCVELVGEAYFDVVHNGASFVVKVDRKEVRVLGTRFNVSGYRAEDMITTLVDGKVEVKNGEMRRQLLPGDQATISDEEGTMSVEKVDTELYTSWVTGKYDFSDTPLSTILSQLELWYGVEIVYKDSEVRNFCFDGTVFRNKSLGFSLDIIQQVSDVQFERAGKVVFVSRQK